MFNKISIIGCGLIGSSILRAVNEKKLASKISVYDKSSKVTDFLKKNFLWASDGIRTHDPHLGKVMLYPWATLARDGKFS